MQHAGPMLIIANPTSGKGRGRRTSERVRDLLIRAGLSAELRFTTATGDAERFAGEACTDGSSRACIIACGGDGTVQEVANALARSRARAPDSTPIMGLAPAGRCNDFGRDLGIGRNPEAIARTLLSGKPRPLDLGRINGRYFCTVATAGIDAAVSRYVDKLRWLRGTPAYVLGAFAVLSRYRAPRLRITGDFGVIEQSVFLASSANTSSYGGAIAIAPDAVPDDGLLDLCVIDAVSRLRALELIPYVLLGRHRNRREVHFYRSRRILIESLDPMELWADGEPVGQAPADIELIPAAIQIMLPVT